VPRRDDFIERQVGLPSNHANKKAACASKGEILPPVGFGAMLPVACRRCTRLIAELGLTSNQSVASRRDAPDSTAFTTRSRNSKGRGFGIDPPSRINAHQIQLCEPVEESRFNPAEIRSSSSLSGCSYGEDNARAKRLQHRTFAIPTFTMQACIIVCTACLKSASATKAWWSIFATAALDGKERLTSKIATLTAVIERRKTRTPWLVSRESWRRSGKARQSNAE
jgi:hypothetical protein